MLLKFSVANFYSIKDKITVDFEAENISTEGSRRLGNSAWANHRLNSPHS